jgi:hypothetical protein
MKKKPTGGLKKLPKAVRNKMGYMKDGGMAKKKMMGGGMPKKDHGKAGSYGKKMMGGGMAKKKPTAKMMYGGMAKKKK